jgi:hypothetical protein
MTYKFFNVQITPIQNNSDLLRRPIEIYKSFIETADNRITSSNFNRYGLPQNLRLEIRFNVTEEQNLVADLQEIADTAMVNGQLQPFVVELQNWPEPPFVVKAHETATSCAVLFREGLDANPQSNTDILQNIEDTMWQFMIQLLRTAGFNPNIIWGYLRQPIPQYLVNLAETCSEPLIEAITDYEVTPDFLERFVHCFYNCTLSKEDRLIQTLTVSSLWQNLADSRNEQP